MRSVCLNFVYTWLVAWQEQNNSLFLAESSKFICDKNVKKILEKERVRVVQYYTVKISSLYGW